MVNKKQQKKVEELQEIIFLCDVIMQEADSLEDYEIAQRQRFDSEVELQELLNKIEKRA